MLKKKKKSLPTHSVHKKHDSLENSLNSNWAFPWHLCVCSEARLHWYAIIFTKLKWGVVLKLLWCLNMVYRQGWGPRGELHRARGSYSTKRRRAETLSDFPSAMHASGMPRETNFQYIHLLTSTKNKLWSSKHKACGKLILSLAYFKRIWS